MDSRNFKESLSIENMQGAVLMPALIEAMDTFHAYDLPEKVYRMDFESEGTVPEGSSDVIFPSNYFDVENSSFYHRTSQSERK